MQRRFGILGGTFNPVHYGHLAAAEEIHERLKLDKVLFIPSFLPPHKREDIPSAEQRLDMVRLATGGNPHFEVCDVEIKRGGKSYTFETLDTLRSGNSDSSYYFITGLDTFLDIQTWNRWEEVLMMASFVVLSRPGYRFSDLLKLNFLRTAAPELEALDRAEKNQLVLRPGAFQLYFQKIPLYDISSTDIRKRIKQGRTVKYLLPESVEHYIIKHTLYA